MMVLAVASAGYAQIMKSSKTDYRPKAERIMKPSRVESMETLQNVQPQDNLLRVEGEELQQTFYDWQTNDAARTWTINWNNGKVDFGFTTAADAAFNTRGTGIVSYDGNTGTWSSSEGRVENEKTGFGTIARYGENGLVVAAHTATECHVYVTEDRESVTAESMAPTSALDNTYSPTWPNVMTSGANRDIIHVIVTANGHTDVPGAEGVSDPLIYFRSMDGGQTWDKQNVILPYLTAEYGLDFQPNCAYWMETTENNRLSLVLSSQWSDGMVIYSDDNGETWNRKVFYSHPNIHGIDTSDWFFCPRWNSALWFGDCLKVAYGWNAGTGTPDNSYYYPGLGGVAYWGDNLVYNPEGQAVSAIPGNLVPGEPFILDTAYLYQDIYAGMWWWSDATHDPWPEYMGYMVPLDANGNIEDYNTAEEMNITGGNGEGSKHGTYYQGLASFPVLCQVPNSEDLVIVWAMLDENCSVNEKYYYHLFANYSEDGGLTWGNMVSLCGGDDYWMYENAEMVYPQAAVIGNELVVVAQVDEIPGSYVQYSNNSEDADPGDNFYVGYLYDLNEIFPNVSVSVPEISHNTKMTISPNPATTQLNVSLNHSSDIVIYTITGQVVNTVKGHVGMNNINISALSSGVYFINAGADTQKFVVK